MNEDKITALTVTGETIIENYESFSVHDNHSLAIASEALSTIRGYLRKVEVTRLELTKPLNDHIKVLNDKFHAITTPIKFIEKGITQKMVGYRAMVEAQRAEEQKRLDAEAQANLDEHALIPEAIAPIVPGQAKSVAVANGKITFIKIRVWKLEDITKVPRAYLKLDEAQITATIKAGDEIPGIRSWTEERPQARR